MNALQDKYGSKGLSVVGVTGEPKGPTQNWIAQHGARFAYGYDKGMKLMRALGANAYPTAVVVDPGGTVVYMGSPGGVTEALVEKHTAGAIATPMWQWPKSAKAIRKALLKGQFAKALQEAEKLATTDEEFARQVTKAVEGLVESKLNGVRNAIKTGDFLTAHDGAMALKKQLAGLDSAEEVEKVLAELKADADAKKVMKAQKKVRKLKAESYRSRKDIEKLIKAAKKILKKNEDNAAGREANGFINKLEARLSKMR